MSRPIQPPTMYTKLVAASVADMVQEWYAGKCEVPHMQANTFEQRISRFQSDLSQASVAAALEAAAQTVDTLGDSAVTEALGTRLCCDGHMCGCQGADVGAYILHHIRALITPAQHDALAAHVAAEVAKARAEDAAKIEALETAAEAGAELAAYASYSEIVGAIGHNRPQIREWCDKVFAAGHVLQDIEWKELTAAHEAAQIGAKP